MSLDARPLRNFITVAEHGSITIAAQRLFISQPSLSRQIKGIERDLGVTLFERTRGSRHIQLTYAGEVFLRQARVLLRELEQTEMLLDEATAEGVGLIRMAASPALMSYVVIPAVAEFRLQWPRCKVELVEADWGSEFPLVERGAVDLAAGNSMMGLRHLRTETLEVALVYALVSETHRLADKEWVAVEELAQEDLLLFKGAPSAQIAFEFFLNVSGLYPRSVFESRLPHTLLSAAEMGLGVAIMTDTVPIDGYRLRAVPLLQDGRQMEVVRVLAWQDRRNLPDLLNSLVQILKRQAVRKTGAGYRPWQG